MLARYNERQRQASLKTAMRMVFDPKRACSKTERRSCKDTTGNADGNHHVERVDTVMQSVRARFTEESMETREISMLGAPTLLGSAFIGVEQGEFGHRLRARHSPGEASIQMEQRALGHQAVGSNLSWRSFYGHVTGNIGTSSWGKGCLASLI
ncbi:hypothetical protein chiPu_0020346 [Chiloscyllium punctatum]|uniref:Uncharacterized protein n=1 Tax=Chiloscyllium punctatum TaxID=137246 RepID=A0A401REN8_CHIPU|nr:hypothetical protein [Chiloscyllium punctatum]